MTRLGQLLRLYRDRNSISARIAAERIGITVSALNRLERTRTGLTAGNYLRISTWLLQSDDLEHRIRR